MAAIRQVIAELVYSDDEAGRTEPEQRFINLIRFIAREEADRPVKVVPLSELPEQAPRYSLWRIASQPDLYMGNGDGEPLSHFVPAP
jgi:hypothetical protein